MSGKRRFDKEIVELAQRGDEGAFAILLSQIEPMLRSFFISRIGVRVDVDDLIQNTLLRVHRGLPDLNDRSRLKSFTMKAAIYELQDFYRGRYSGKERLFDADPPTNYSNDAEEIGADIDVQRALNALSHKARTIMELREYGYRYEEIAQKLGTTVAAVKMQVKRAFEKMREVLDAPNP
jgi:RNA polymerase sigma-70 factor (ECF subfamily)